MLFLELLKSKWFGIAIAIAIIISGTTFLYHKIYESGYAAAEGYYKPILADQKAKVKELESAEKLIEYQTVIEYRDRIKTVREIQEKIVEVTKDVLKDENTQCTIGTNFIRLHNASASNQTISRSPGGVDATSTTPNPSAGTN